jgi:hypothetical protein
MKEFFVRCFILILLLAGVYFGEIKEISFIENITVFVCWVAIVLFTSIYFWPLEKFCFPTRKTRLPKTRRTVTVCLEIFTVLSLVGIGWIVTGVFLGIGIFLLEAKVHYIRENPELFKKKNNDE